MSHRMQITLTDEQYRALRSESEGSGVPIAEIVRRRIDEGRARLPLEERLRLIRETAGSWGPGESGADFVERMRPGVEARLNRRSE